jgi:hypothetical protein
MIYGLKVWLPNLGIIPEVHMKSNRLEESTSYSLSLKEVALVPPRNRNDDDDFSGNP